MTTELDAVAARKPFTVLVTWIDLWVIQKSIKFNTFMLDPRNMRPIFPTVGSQHTAWKLRTKVNDLLIRTVQENLGDTFVELPLDLDECWYIDNQVGPESYDNSRRLLLQVFLCIWEHEHPGVTLKTVMGGSNRADGSFDLNELIAYLAQASEDERRGWYQLPSSPDDEPPIEEVPI